MEKADQLKMIKNIIFPDLTDGDAKGIISYLYDSGVRIVDNESSSFIASTLKNFAEKIKLRFYYNFDELIPSIMSDEIDKILEETLEEDD